MTNTPTGWIAVLFLFTALALGTAGCPGEEGDDDDSGHGDDDDATADDDDATADDDDATPGDDDDATPGDDDDATPGDDDDATPGDDDDATPGDDDDDDTVGDDDDTVGDDDDTTPGFDLTGQMVTEEGSGYVHRQTLQGMHAAALCPDCEYTFDIEYTTLAQAGSCDFCWDLADGTYTLGLDMDYTYGGVTSPSVFLEYYGSWYFFYYGVPGYDGHTLGVYFYLTYYNYVLDQHGYWDFDVPDADGDGFTALDDCDDSDPAVYPGAPEVCNGQDDDCDPNTLDAADADGDGFSAICDGDCDDADPAVHPYAAEGCDGLDTDCDGAADPSEVDADGDGFMICDGDCDDADPAAFPGNPEVCDGVDNDCDPSTDEAADVDADGFTECDGDCDDGNADVNPGAAEACDGVDTNCDGAIPNNETDADADGFLRCEGDCDDSDAAVNPGATEICDGVDNNCDGAIDEVGCSSITGMALTIENTPYLRRQELAGTAAASNCPGCEYTFDITYTTVIQNGTSLWNYDMDDGTYTLGYDGDYMYAGSSYEVVFLDYNGGWYLWYMAQAGYGGHDIAFSWYNYYYSYTVSQYGYWDF